MTKTVGDSNVFCRDRDSCYSPLSHREIKASFSAYVCAFLARRQCQRYGPVAVHASARSCLQEPGGSVQSVDRARCRPNPGELPLQICYRPGSFSRAAGTHAMWVGLFSVMSANAQKWVARLKAERHILVTLSSSSFVDHSIPMLSHDDTRPQRW